MRVRECVSMCVCALLLFFRVVQIPTRDLIHLIEQAATATATATPMTMTAAATVTATLTAR